MLWLIVIGGVACGRPSDEPAEPAPVAEPGPEASQVADDAAIEAARAAAKQLGGTLKSRVAEAMASGGPEAAIVACADEAQALTATVAAETDARVGRSSLRLRNPANEAPEWVATWLVAQGERPAEGAEGFARVDETATGRVARVVAPIPVDAVCVTCHGATETLPAQVKEVLATRYPSDQATGYQAGDLRGAIWAEVPVRAASAGP